MEESSRRLVKLILGEVALLFILAALLTYLTRFVGVGPFEEILARLMTPAVVVVFILISTMLFISVLRPIFEKSLSKFMSQYEVQYTWQIIKYSIWIASLLILAFLLIGTTVSLSIIIGMGILFFILLYYKALMNFAGWLYIIFHHHIKLGDIIEINGIKGKIVGITMMNTLLIEIGEFLDKRRQTNRTIMIPNSFVFSNPIYSLSKEDILVWDEIKILLPAKTDYLLAKDIVTQVVNNIAGPIMRKHRQEMIKSSSNPDKVPSQPTVLISIEPQGVLIGLTYFCQQSERPEVRSAVAENILSEFNREGIELALYYPQT
ncbi:MAG: mechanosensitive ion channel family protein [Thermoplasmata archaeon]|nr:MAG: mechanosensitive ion channel family protein [Thermoplasmata archaeon]